MSTAAKYQLTSPLASSKVDAETGIIRDVALVSIGEAAGHSTRIDQKTLEMFYALVKGQTVKAFVNHSDNPKPTEAVGIYSGFYIDVEAGVMRAAQFQAFKAFRENSKEAYDTLFEMAAIAPESFGISANFYLDLETASDGGDPYARPTHVESFDIVCTPAANKALFSRKPDDEKPLDAPKEMIQQQSSPDVSKIQLHSFMKLIYAQFSANPKALSRACQLAAEAPADKPVTEEEVIAKVELEMDAEEQAAIIAERDALIAKVTELEAKVAELSPKADNESALNTKVAELSAKNAEQVTQIAQLSKGRARFGAAPVVIGKPDGKDAPTLTRAQFTALDPKAQGEHFAVGGKLTE